MGREKTRRAATVPGVPSENGPTKTPGRRRLFAFLALLILSGAWAGWRALAPRPILRALGPYAPTAAALPHQHGCDGAGIAEPASSCAEPQRNCFWPTTESHFTFTANVSRRPVSSTIFASGHLAYFGVDEISIPRGGACAGCFRAFHNERCLVVEQPRSVAMH